MTGAAPVASGPQRDRRLLYAAAFLRALATGTVGVLLGLYLARLALPARTIALIVGAGLAGAAAASLLVAMLGDRIGRRRMLLALAAVGGIAGLALAGARDAALLGGLAFLGMVNGMGRDRGAALVLEQAALPATATDAERTAAFAWYNVVQDVGHALGALVATLPGLAESALGLDALAALRAGVALPALLVLASAGCYLGLSPAVEAPRDAVFRPVTPATRRVLAKLSGLFVLDAIGGGFLTTALLALFLAARFDVGPVTLGALFFAARVLNAASHVAAAWLARRIGLVNTMVFTHLPSSLLLVTVAIAPTFPVAAALFLLREGLVEMDVPTRQSYVMAVVRPEERTLASGVTSLVRLGGWAAAPLLAGLVVPTTASALPLVAGAALKITYDLLLWRAFRGLRPPEERGSG